MFSGTNGHSMKRKAGCDASVESDGRATIIV